MELNPTVEAAPAIGTMRVKQVIFLVLAAAFFLLPWIFPAVRNHAPGVAVLCGVAFAVLWGNPYEAVTAKLTSPLLGAAIVGMGFGMNLAEVLRAGAHGMIYTLAGISLGLGLGIVLGRRLGLQKNTMYLISIGTSICGGSAIAAAAPVLKAKAHDIAIASAVVFTLNAVALLVFPAVGHALGMSQYQFGYWSALGIHDTSSVVGATMAFGPEALEVGTTVKLARALWIVPVTLFLSMCVAPAGEGEKRKIRFRIPVVHSGIPGGFGAGHLGAGDGGTGFLPERALEIPDDRDAVPDRSEPEPGQAEGARREAGGPRGDPLGDPGRNLVRGDPLRHRPLKGGRSLCTCVTAAESPPVPSSLPVRGKERRPEKRARKLRKAGAGGNREVVLPVTGCRTSVPVSV